MKLLLLLTEKACYLPIFMRTVTMMPICLPWFITWNDFTPFIPKLYRYLTKAFFENTRLTSRPNLEVRLSAQACIHMVAVDCMLKLHTIDLIVLLSIYKNMNLN